HPAAAGNGTVVLRGGHAVPISKRCRAQPDGGCAPRRIDAWRPPAAATGSRRSSRPAAVPVIALGPRRDATLAALGETADEWIGHGLVAVLPLRLAGDVQAPLVDRDATLARMLGRRRWADPSGSALEQLELVRLAFPLLGVGRWVLARGDHRPFLRQLGVERHEVLLPGGHVVLGVDRVDRALGFAQGAIDALVRIDHQEVRALVETVDRAHLDAVGVLALDAVFGDDEGHFAKVPWSRGSLGILEQPRAGRCEAFASARAARPKGRPACAGLLEDGAPYGTRTRVLALRGLRPRPLDEGSVVAARGGADRMGDRCRAPGGWPVALRGL